MPGGQAKRLCFWRMPGGKGQLPLQRGWAANGARPCRRKRHHVDGPMEKRGSSESGGEGAVSVRYGGSRKDGRGGGEACRSASGRENISKGGEKKKRKARMDDIDDQSCAVGAGDLAVALFSQAQRD